ncbi:MAG TPA: FAD-dependent oxidoreductase [Phycisphaerae bacterium]|nr:FAD-dependent oxidoreductase [Phycisphaerae bacterium]
MSQNGKKIVIVGGVAGGASAATRARRMDENASIVMFERSGYVSFANCGLPYHIGETISKREKLLVTTAKALWERFRIDARVRHEVTAINRSRKTVTVKKLDDGSIFEQPYDALLLSPGGKPTLPDIPGIHLPNVHALRVIEDMDAIKSAVDRSGTKSAVVVGGGFIGLEVAEELVRRNLAVTMLQSNRQVFSQCDYEMASPLIQQLLSHGINLRVKTTAKAIAAIDGGRLAVTTSHDDTIEADLVVIGIGVRPEAHLAGDAGLELGPTGGIKVDKSMRTTDPNIWAVGDAVEVTNFVTGKPVLIPLAGPANRQGRLAADAMLGRTVEYNASQGTAICKVFDATVAVTGISERIAKAQNIPCQAVFVHPQNHAGYYPGAVPMTVKLVFSPQDGKILGAQVVGTEGVDKRIDVFATALRAGLTVFDLEELELAYAPPYGSAKDPVNMAGFAAANVMRGDTAICHSQDIIDRDRQKVFLLDVRTPEEFALGTIDDAKNIPLDSLRERLNELPKDKELIVFCQAGLRGYIASRILLQNGFTECKNLSGGYKIWKMYNQPAPNSTPITACGKEMEAIKMNEQAAPAGGASEIVRDIDACGLQCPGPIMQLKAAIDEVKPGQSVRIRTTDAGFIADVPAWCGSTGNTLINLGDAEKGVYSAVITKGHAAATQETKSAATEPAGRDKTIVVFSNDFDKVMAAFIIANGAAAMGSKVTMFFTFWGLNVLRRKEKIGVRKNLVEKMFGWMMPRGSDKLPLSKMNFAGLGKRTMLGIMRKKNVATLDELIGSARLAGVKMVACNMSMNIMGIRPEELIAGVEIGGVAMYLSRAEQGNVNLFI